MRSAKQAADQAPTAGRVIRAMVAAAHRERPKKQGRLLRRVVRQDADHIGAQTEEGRVTEAHHRAIADDQIEADRGQAKIRTRMVRVIRKGSSEQAGDRRHGGEDQQADSQDDGLAHGDPPPLSP